MDEAQVTTPPSVDPPASPAASVMQGPVEGRDLLEIVKMLNRLKKTGVLTAKGPENRAEIYIKQGAVVAAFYNDLSGASALTRGLLIGKAAFEFAPHEGRFPNNVLQDTVFILESVDKILAEYGDRLWAPDGQAAVLGDDEDDGLSPSDEQDAPETPRPAAPSASASSRPRSAAAPARSSIARATARSRSTWRSRSCCKARRARRSTAA
jgi:hypothetical protein